MAQAHGITEFIPTAALVTGGSRGIGAATVQALAARGARVAIGYRADRAAAQAVLESAQGSGHMLIQADILEEGAAERLVSEAADGLGGLDLVVNNAAIRGHHPIATTDAAAWRGDWARIIGANLVGPADICYFAARAMIQAGVAGAIINVSSRGALRGEPDMPAYGASKAGLNALTRSLAQALGPYGIHVAAVAPGFVQTEGTAARLEGPEGPGIRSQSPMGRVATAREVAEAIVYLASARMATGSILDLNGGSHLR
ncbi:MAG: SDR family oxidoreductase [Rhodothermales bacterium]|nr:SDR family oxidoreductase [Rhodothermales bacterium]